MSPQEAGEGGDEGRTEDRLDFLWLALLDERVKDDYMLALTHIEHMSIPHRVAYSEHTHPGQPKEVRVAVGATLRSVDLVQVLERELELGREGLDAGAEVAFGEGREFVEQRLDDGGIEDDHGHLEGEPVCG